MKTEEFLRQRAEREKRLKRRVIAVTCVLCAVWIPVALLWVY